MGWTERKTGFTDSVPPGISNMGFRAGQREDLGGLSTITTVMPQVDGDDALMKTFAEKFRKVIYTPRPEDISKCETWRVAVKVIDPRGNEGLRVLTSN